MADKEMNVLTSPDFKRVTGKLRVVKRRKRSHFVSDSALPSSSLAVERKGSAVRPRNPFRSLSINPAGDVSADTSVSTPNDESVESDCFIPRTPEKSDHGEEKEDEELVIPKTPEEDEATSLKRRRLTREDYSLVTKPVSSSRLFPDGTNQKNRVTDILPADFSLYSKVRITSTYDLHPLTQTSEETIAQALTDFITDSPLQTGSPPQRFHRLMHHYIYPNMPWLSLYPRRADDKAKPHSLPQEAWSLMKDEWRSSLASAYSSLESNHLSCGYFYMLCDGFTVLFHRCAKCSEISAVVSPTTRGFRQSLQARGINFVLPLQESKPLTQNSDRESTSTSTSHNTTSGDNQETAEDDEQNASLNEGRETDDPLEWLENIGLEKSLFPSLRSSKVQMEEEAFKSIDYRPTSTVLVVGQQMVTKLKDFVRDYEKTMATTGQLASVPPTIVSRSPFVGATLQKLQMRTGQMVSEQGGDKHTYINLAKPLLPGVVNDIIDHVIKQNVPAESSVNVNMIAIDDTHVFNIRKCTSCPDETSTTERIASFVYKDCKYHHDN